MHPVVNNMLVKLDKLPEFDESFYTQDYADASRKGLKIIPNGQLK